MALLVMASLGTNAAEVRMLFGMFAVAALRLMPSVRNIMSCWAAVKYNRYTIDILGEAHPDAEERSGEQSAERLPFRERIRLDGVSFHFDDAPGHDVLHDLSLTIRKGSGWESAGARVPARPPSSICCWASTPPPRAPSSSTARRSTTGRAAAGRTAWATSRRRSF